MRNVKEYQERNHVFHNNNENPFEISENSDSLSMVS